MLHAFPAVGAMQALWGDGSDAIASRRDCGRRLRDRVHGADQARSRDQGAAQHERQVTEIGRVMAGQGVSLLDDRGQGDRGAAHRVSPISDRRVTILSRFLAAWS